MSSTTSGPRLARRSRRDRSTPCPLCGGRTRDGLLCRTCTEQTAKRLAEFPSLWVDLQLTITRRARLNPPGTRPAETPLVFNEAASRVADRILCGTHSVVDGVKFKHRGLIAWADWLCRTARVLPSDGGAVGLAEFLADNLQSIIRSGEGGDFASDMWAWGDAIRTAVDYPWERKIKAGHCPEMCEDAPCNGELWALLSDRPGEGPVVVCVPPLTGVLTCGQEWDASQWNRLGERIVARATEIAEQAVRAAAILRGAA